MKAKKKKLCGSGKNVGRIKNSMGGGGQLLWGQAWWHEDKDAPDDIYELVAWHMIAQKDLV